MIFWRWLRNNKSFLKNSRNKLIFLYKWYFGNSFIIEDVVFILIEVEVEDEDIDVV